MSAFTAYPELVVVQGQIDGLFRIETTKGNVVIAGSFRSESEAQRLVDCWNACRKIAFPSAHIEATDEYCKRVEQLRKDAWSRVQELEARA